MPLIELIIFAVLAGVVLYQLYSVLGRRVGRQPEDMVPPTAPPPSMDELSMEPPMDDAPSAGLAALRARDPNFDVSSFLHGARQAYEMIVIAFAKGDRDTLNKLLAPPVMEGFETAMTTREKEGRTEQIEFLHPPRADLERVETAGDIGRAVVRFLAEFRSRSKGPEGEAVDDRRTAELWTFERSLRSRDPNWTLVHVDTAEA